MKVVTVRKPAATNTAPRFIPLYFFHLSAFRIPGIRQISAACAIKTASKRPFAVTEDRERLAVFITGDIQIRRADHKIHMDHALVDPERLAFFV